MAVPLALGAGNGQRLLSHRQLVGVGACVVRLRDGPARAHVPLAGVDDTGLRTRPSGDFRRVETGNALSDPELHGAGDRAAGAGIYLQQISREDQGMVVMPRRPLPDQVSCLEDRWVKRSVRRPYVASSLL